MKVSDLQRISHPLTVNPPKATPAEAAQGAGKNAFGDVLKAKLGEAAGVQFSAHAAERIAQREIAMTPEVLSRLKDGVEQLHEKGGKSALIMVDETAYIVSVKHRTVITAVDPAGRDSNVFTNIDSVAIV